METHRTVCRLDVPFGHPPPVAAWLEERDLEAGRLALGYCRGLCNRSKRGAMRMRGRSGRQSIKDAGYWGLGTSWGCQGLHEKHKLLLSHISPDPS